ncbi:MAG: hypothetical protein OEO79_15935 [Gemmatimonadota bacterium]|nr:hypothetical protein [Gemmatimonadota bacterium]
MARRAGVGAGVPSPPTWLPAVIFVGLTLLLFRKFVFSNLMLYGGDTLGLGYVARAFYAESLTELGTFPRWAPLILGGTPFLEALSGGDSLYPPSVLLLLLMEPYRALGWKLVIHVALAGFFMYGWVRALGASRPAALVSGIAYLLAPYLISLVHPGHDGRLFVTALAPLLFWAVERHFVRPRLQSFTAIAFVIGAIIYTTHFQMAYFLFGAVGLYAMFRSVEIWRTPQDDADEEPAPTGRVATNRFALFLAASVTGAAVGGVQLFPAVDYVTEFSRRTQTTSEVAGESGVAWSSSWSMHPEEAMGLLIPEFAGNNAGGADWAQGLYWGRNVFKDNHEAAGVVVLLLAALAFVGGRRRSVRFFFAGLASVAFLFALGTHTPLWRIFYEVVPGIRLFRAPAQVMFLFALSAATLAGLGLDRLLSLGDKTGPGGTVMKVLWGATGVFALLALLASSGTLTSFWTSAVNPDLDPGRLQRLDALAPFISRGAGISFLLALGTTGLAWALRAGYLAPAGVVVGIGLLVVADEFRVSDGFVQVMDFQQWSAPDPNTQAVLRAESGSAEPYRMLSMRDGNGQDIRPALHGIELAGGHHPNDLARYRELIGMSGSSAPMNLLETANIRRILNVRYILWPDAQLGSVQGTVFSQTALPDGRPYESVLAENGLPRARLVGATVVRPDAEAVPYMRSDAFDPEREVVLAEPPPIELDGQAPTGSVTWISRSPNELQLAVETERPALLVVADNWFPAWRARVDGVDVPILRAYHTLRAVPIGPGEHTVEMYYQSDAVRWSLWLSVFLLVGLAGATGFQTWRERTTRRES